MNEGCVQAHCGRDAEKKTFRCERPGLRTYRRACWPPMKSSAGLNEESWDSLDGGPFLLFLPRSHTTLIRRCALSPHPLRTWWPSQPLRLPVFRKSISKVSRRQHTYSCVDVKPLTSLREFRITNSQRFLRRKYFWLQYAQACQQKTRLRNGKLLGRWKKGAGVRSQQSGQNGDWFFRSLAPSFYLRLLTSGGCFYCVHVDGNCVLHLPRIAASQCDRDRHVVLANEIKNEAVARH